MTETRPILVTGSAGLIGSLLVKKLWNPGDRTGSENSPAVRYDTRISPLLDVLRTDTLMGKMGYGYPFPCRGIVHLAGVSRVVDGELDPTRCHLANVKGTASVVRAAAACGAWVIYASSREVYGNCKLPATEAQTPLDPCNNYAQSKLDAERFLQDSGVQHSILRFSNVYGSFDDHPDRVVPAFMSAARDGFPLFVEGKDNMLDFVHREDAVAGILAAIKAMDDGRSLPPMHLTTGVGTTLLQLAELCKEIYESDSNIRYKKQRDYDVARFFGSYRQAQSILGWSPKVPLRTGLLWMKDRYHV